MKKHALVSIVRSCLCFFFATNLAPAVLSQTLTIADVQNVIAAAVSKAAARNEKVTVSIADREGNLLGTFQMTGAPATTLIRSVGRAGQGLENISVKSTAAAYSKIGRAHD